MNYLRTYSYLVLFNLLLLSAVYFFFPQTTESLFQEDLFVENMTIALYFSGMIVSIFFILRNRDKHHKALLAVPFISLVFMLEELSYGERIFLLSPPQISGVKVDSVHDLISLGVRILAESGNILIVAGFIVFSILYCLMVIMYIRKYLKLPQFLKEYPQYYLVLAAFALLAVSASIDLFDPLIEGKRIFSLRFLEESLEMNAALAMLFAAFMIKTETSGKRDSAVFFRSKEFMYLITTVAFVLVTFFLYSGFISNLNTVRENFQKEKYIEARAKIDDHQFDQAMIIADKLEQGGGILTALYIRYLVVKSKGDDEGTVFYAKKIFETARGNVLKQDVRDTMINYYINIGQMKKAEAVALDSIKLSPEDGRIKDAFKRVFGYLPEETGLGRPQEN